MERLLIDALPLRYNNPADPAAEAVAWSVAMSGAWEKSNNDPNVGALYAESMLDLRPWAVYDSTS